MASDKLAAVQELLRGVDLGDLTIPERCAAFESVASPPAPGATVEPVDAGGVPAEWVVAAGVDSDCVLLYLHGGAYQVGSPATLRRMIALISAAAQVRVLSARLPAGTGASVSRRRGRRADRLSVPAAQQHRPAAIAIAGDSACGGLTLATLVALRDAGDPLPAAAVAISPWTDLALTGESLTTRADVDVMIKPDGMRETRRRTWPARSPAPVRFAAVRRPARAAADPDPRRRRRGDPRRLDPVRREGTRRRGRRHAGSLGRDAARLARVRRPAARVRPGHRAHGGWLQARCPRG